MYQYFDSFCGGFNERDDFEKIGKRLKEIRLSKGLPQDAVAGAAEVNTSHKAILKITM